MGGRISTMAEARFVGAPLRLRLGGQRLLQARMEPQAEVHAGADGRDAAGGRERADRLSRPDVCAEAATAWKKTARRFEGARLGRRAASSHWRWRARVLEEMSTRRSRRRGINDATAAQDIERHSTKLAKSMCKLTRTRICARSAAISEPGRGGSGDDRPSPRNARQMRQGRRMPDQGSSPRC